MRLEFGETPAHEGVFGPEIWLNAVSGAACLRYDDGTTVGCPPEEPVTNAFVVWLARPVVVVSEGVDAVAVPAVAKELRALLEDPTVPVVFLLRRARAMSDGTGVCSDRELARAEAYVRVQAGFEEHERIVVELDGQSYAFRLAFLTDGSRAFRPHIE